MKIGLISDIHANIFALKAVIENGHDEVNTWICAGDIIGYYPYANEVCNLLLKHNVISIRGNHEAYILNILKPDNALRTAYKIDTTLHQLTERNLNWLASLPIEILFSWEDIKLTVRHASPWDETTYLYPDSAKLSKIHLASNQILFVGHTHHPMQRECGNGIIINAGSVGQPRDWNPDAAYAILNTTSKTIEFKRVSYQTEMLIEELKQLGYSEKETYKLIRKK